jgi:GT2 family glycosyltransferase
MIKKNKRIGFVILHYNEKRITELCVAKLLSLEDSERFEIAIVDNNSPNKSGFTIKKDYSKYSNIHVIISNKNLGFAKGNNLGFNYLKENFELAFMFVMNNDVLINDKGIISKIYNIYNFENFDVLGPDIYAPRKTVHQNPFRDSALTYKEMQEMRDFFESRSKMYFFFFVRHKIGNFVRKIFNSNHNVNERNELLSLKKNDVKSKNSIVMDMDNNFVLHGACYIFSKNFLEKRNYAFWPGTFMFFEEDILQFECKNNNLKMLFCPSIQVTHLEDVSTNTILKSNYKKDRFKCKQLYHSLNSFLNTFYKQ